MLFALEMSPNLKIVTLKTALLLLSTAFGVNGHHGPRVLPPAVLEPDRPLVSLVYTPATVVSNVPDLLPKIKLVTLKLALLLP